MERVDKIYAGRLTRPRVCAGDEARIVTRPAPGQSSPERFPPGSRGGKSGGEVGGARHFYDSSFVVLTRCDTATALRPPCSPPILSPPFSSFPPSFAQRTRASCGVIIDIRGGLIQFCNERKDAQGRLAFLCDNSSRQVYDRGIGLMHYSYPAPYTFIRLINSIRL